MKDYLRWRIPMNCYAILKHLLSLILYPTNLIVYNNIHSIIISYVLFNCLNFFSCFDF